MALKRASVPAACALLLLAGSARAGGDDEHEAAAYERLLGRPHTVALLQAGILALPFAQPLSPRTQGGNVPFVGALGQGDATVETGVNVIFRVARDWAFGAEFEFGPRPTSDTQYGGNSGLPRTHARSYVFWGLEGRWFPLRYKWLEGWVGLSAGEVVLADRFGTDVGDPKPTILGQRQVTISTEGFSTGLQVGSDWLLTEHVVFGVVTRADLWVLPTTPACTAIGDCATLSGGVFAFEVALNLGYRIPL